MNDQAARDRIARDLDTNLLVEAGAGSGKTTSLVGRLCALVEQGVPVEQVAAVTFTRKAANELRQRFQEALEQRVADSGVHAGRTGRLTAALRDLDRAFLGTIHAFAARLLREQALEAGVDPGFEELDETEMQADEARAWDRWLEQARVGDDPDLAELRTLGIDPRQLLDGFRVVVANADVQWVAEPVPPPDPATALGRLRRLLKESFILLPPEEPKAGWDALQDLVRHLYFLEQTRGSTHLADAMALLGQVRPSRCKVVQNRWSDTKDGKAAAKALGETWQAFAQETVEPLRVQWYEHRYAPVLRVLERAATRFQAERWRSGRLGFEDLLVLVARLLRTRPSVRAALGQRYARLLVDEFQDTDPLQAEICFLLASDPAEGDDWRAVRPRPGALFVVGDPKQSIYRFRRADLGIYAQVRQRFQAMGDVLHLTQNFRSNTAIADLVNAHFRDTLPDTPSTTQAPFAPMETAIAPSGDDGVYLRIVDSGDAGGSRGAIAEADAQGLAAWIRARLDAGVHSAGEFLILTQQRAELAAYAEALAAQNVPTTTSGAELRQERELTELILLLRLLADPGNPVLLVAVLEGLFMGLDPAELFAARQAGTHLDLLTPPSDSDGRVEQALQRLRRWWQASRERPPDHLLDLLLDETGLLPRAASQPLGEEGAGALLHLVEAVRASDRGMTGLRGTIAVLESALGADDGVAALRPGRADSVRIMNLHKAKGLEAEVVILAAPVPWNSREPRVSLSREGEGAGRGWLQVVAGQGNQVEVIAQPPGWARRAAEEATQLEAERERLLYVAATRAKRVLVVTDRLDGKDAGLWRGLTPSLAGRARPLSVPAPVETHRRELAVDAATLEDRTAKARRSADHRGRPGLTVTSVTRALRQDRQDQQDHSLPHSGDGAGGMRARGDAIHRVVEAMGRGRQGESLRLFTAGVAQELGLSPELEAGVLAAAEAVRSMPEWQGLMTGNANYELTVMEAVEQAGEWTITEGVIDAVVERDGAWQVLDWKSGGGEGKSWAVRLADYQAQVARYEAILRTAGLRTEGGAVVRVGAP